MIDKNGVFLNKNDFIYVTPYFDEDWEEGVYQVKNFINDEKIVVHNKIFKHDEPYGVYNEYNPKGWFTSNEVEKIPANKKVRESFLFLKRLEKQ